MRLIESNYDGKCRVCKTPHYKGTPVFWERGTKGVLCQSCGKGLKTRQDCPQVSTPAVKSGKPPELIGGFDTWTIDWWEIKARALALLEGKTIFKNRTNQRHIESHTTNIGEYDSWRGYGKPDLERWLKRGFQPEGMRLDNPPIPIRDRRYLEYDEDGEEYHHDRLLSGEDDIFSSWTEQQSIPGLAVKAEICFSAAVEQSTLKAYYAWLCRTLYALETSGVDCEVSLTYTVERLYAGENTKTQTLINVKHENEASDFNSWSAMLSPASLRSLGFLASISHAEERGKTASGGLGGYTEPMDAWRVFYEAEKGQLVIHVDYRARSSFPEDRMTAELQTAIKAMAN